MHHAQNTTTSLSHQVTQLKETTIAYFDKVIDVLYGDEMKTQRTLALCMIAMSFGFLLANQAPMVCGL